jgi:hypothetical protein
MVCVRPTGLKPGAIQTIKSAPQYKVNSIEANPEKDPAELASPGEIAGIEAWRTA